MRASDVSRSLVSLLPTKLPVYLWGPPGVGKSSVVHQATSALSLELCDVRAVLLDPVDLRGLPHVNGDGRAHWCIPEFLPRDGQGVLFLDELAQAPPLVQAACLQLTLDRRIGEYVLPDGWTIVAASNRQEDRAGAHRLISPLLNRFLHLDLEVHHDDWQDWAASVGLAMEVRSFLRFRPALLHQFDPTSGARAFPTPRSWEFVARVLASTPLDLLHPVVAGCIGDGPAAEFVAYVGMYRKLPDIDTVLANPSSATVPTEPSVLYAVCGAIAQRCRGAGPDKARAAACYANRLPPEFGTVAIRDIVAGDASAIKLPEVQDFVKRHRLLLAA